MKIERLNFLTIDEYIHTQPKDIQTKLIKLRKVIKEIAPQSNESISYMMPAFKLHGKPLVYFAAFKNHIGFFPTPSGVEAFINELTEYKTSKGAIQFPLDKPIPTKLVKSIIRYRVKELSDKNK